MNQHVLFRGAPIRLRISTFFFTIRLFTAICPCRNPILDYHIAWKQFRKESSIVIGAPVNSVLHAALHLCHERLFESISVRKATRTPFRNLYKKCLCIRPVQT